MDVADGLITVILEAIRARAPIASVVFLAGHTHYRGYNPMDNRAVSMESGKYLDTIGFLSCSLPAVNAQALKCEHAFITPHLKTFLALSGASKKGFATKAAKKMQADIDAARARLELDRVIGCAPADFLPSAPVGAPQSLWGLYLGKVVPAAVFDGSLARPVFAGSPAAPAPNWTRRVPHPVLTGRAASLTRY
jgi:hypothetical protein